MSFVVYLAGLVIGIAVFLWLLSTYHQGVDHLARVRESKQPQPPDAARPTRIEEQRFNRQRTCPLCSATLTGLEALYAATVETEGGKKILIYGCRYCYRPDDSRDINEEPASHTLM